MGFKDISNAVTSRLGRQILTVQKHSPKILFVAGTVGVVATVALAVRATLKVEEVLEVHDDRLDKIEKATVMQAPNIYSAEDATKDKVMVFVKTAGNLARLYAPAIIVGSASIACLTGSHFILSNRLGNVTAAYAALDKGFRAYRARVIEELGPQKDAEFRHGYETKDIVEEGPNGPEVTTIKTVKGSPSIYARHFEKSSSSSWSPQYGQNQFFIKCQQDWANSRLHNRGHLLLNEVYDMLGLSRTREGCVVGWVMNGDGDGFVDFGVFNNDEFTISRFLNGEERSILLDFNVDGVIYDKI